MPLFPHADKSKLFLLLIWLLPAYMPGVAVATTDGTVEIARPTDEQEGTESDSLTDIQHRGSLRILVPSNLEENQSLPRKGPPLDYQQEAAATFARSLGLDPIIAPVQALKDMLSRLLSGEGDLIAAAIPITEDSKIAFSTPLDYVREQLIIRSDQDTIEDLMDLKGRTVMLDPGSTSWATMQNLREEQHLEIELRPQPPELEAEDAIELVAQGKVDATIQGSDTMKMFLEYRNDVKVAFDISEKHPIAWGVRPNAPQLQNALNQYIQEEKLIRTADEAFLDDLPEIRERRVLRVLLRNNAASYFLWRGELLGFEYELARRFAQQNDLRIEVVVPPSHELLITWLLQGKGDIAAGFLHPSERLEERGITFSRPYHHSREYVVTRSDEPELARPEELAGRTLVVRRTSSYWQSLQAIQAQGITLKLVAAPENMETEEIIAKVAEGEYDLTVAGGHLLDIELTARGDIRAAFALGDSMPHAWAVRAGNEKLLAGIDEFFNEEYRGIFYNMTYRKYFKNPGNIRVHLQHRVDRVGGGALSPYDALVRKYARQYDLDWRLITAQMFEESRFDPAAVSWAGAQGLMQVMPHTATEMGFPDLEDTETGLHAGIKYLNWVKERFDPKLPPKERLWFALAAYNAGAGHVHDARRLARQMDWDRNRWFNHVEKAMLLLAKEEYASKARYGYVRGREPVQYVRSIKERYNAYVRLTEPLLAMGDGEFQ